MFPQNPFTTLYVTERLGGDEFPALFSPTLVPQVRPLFEAGNVVVHGTQGTGKSMLLALLHTDIRVAFHEQNVEYPAGLDGSRFVNAGINLATNQALRFASRWSSKAANSIESELRSCFIDYVNVWLLHDLLNSLDVLLTRGRQIWAASQLGDNQSTITEVLDTLASSDIWISAFPKSGPSLDIVAALRKRIESYWAFLNGREREAPAPTFGAHGSVIGEPIARVVQAFQRSGHLSESTRVFVTIDQFEQLLEVEAKLASKPFGILRDAVDAALHLREPTLSFRVGTRPNAWRNRDSEEQRDFRMLRLDELLRRKEHSNHLFQEFADDVFRRRLRRFGYASVAATRDPLLTVFGRSDRPLARVKRASPGASWSKHLAVPADWPATVRDGLQAIAERDPVSAKLGVAWILQHVARGETPVEAFSLDGIPAWEQPEKKWWRKERYPLAVLQLAAACRQRVPLGGKKDILDLSGANILVFGSICQHIWDCWIRSLVRERAENSDSWFSSPISRILQQEGLRNASFTWREKVSEEPWVGDSLKPFIDELGNWLHLSLIKDKQMSYPGGNGISLAASDLQQSPESQAILYEAADRGFLIQVRHTPKNRARGESVKWYLHPILAPYYEITISHTKEPRYLRSDAILRLMAKAGLVMSARRGTNRRQSAAQRQLPGFETGDEE